MIKVSKSCTDVDLSLMELRVLDYPPKIFDEQNLIILTGEKFTLFSSNKGLIGESEYLWKDRWIDYVSKSNVRGSRYFEKHRHRAI